MKNLLLWLVPPLMGAIIGYVTNAVAIKMLFRPLKPFFILRFRLPFTPGILPRQRHQLADSIGSMVERELLTAEILRERLQREDIRETIGASVSGFTGKILETPLAGLDSAKDAIAPLAAPLLRDFFSSPAFDSLVDAFLHALLGGIRGGEENTPGAFLRKSPGDRSIREILGEEYSQKLTEGLEGHLRMGFSSVAGKLPDLFETLMERSFPGLAAALIRFMSRPEVHGELEVQGRIFLNNAILKLNVVQRFFISAGQYDRTLHERMPEIIDDLIRQCDELLGDPQIRERLISFLRGTVQGLLLDPAASEGIVRIIADFLSAYLDRPLGELLRDQGGGGIEAWARRIYRSLKETGAGGIGRTAGAGFKFFLEAHPGITLGEFLSLGAEKKDRLDAFIRDKLLNLADTHLEALLGTIDVRTLVSERIDSLDMIKVEHIVLDVMANQLKWINIFGAILGALIGLFQSAFNWFTRGL
jgi:hypothetical protein